MRLPLSAAPFVLAATLLAGPAHAQTEWVARAKNNSGGLIVLLAAVDTCINGRRMYTSSPTGRSQWGCWIATDNHIIVAWDGQSHLTTYDYAGWELNPARERPNAQPNRNHNF